GEVFAQCYCRSRSPQSGLDRFWRNTGTRRRAGAAGGCECSHPLPHRCLRAYSLERVDSSMKGAPMYSAWIRLRSHVITGFIFVMPVLITLAVLMKFWSHLLKVGSRLAKLFHVNTVFGPSGDAVMAVFFLLLVCFVGGFFFIFSFFNTMCVWLIIIDNTRIV